MGDWNGGYLGGGNADVARRRWSVFVEAAFAALDGEGEMPPERLLRQIDLVNLLPVSEYMLLKLEREGLFPAREPRQSRPGHGYWSARKAAKWWASIVVGDRSNPLCEPTVGVDEVMEITGWSKATLWEKRRSGRFPQPRFRFGGLRWFLADVRVWCAANDRYLRARRAEIARVSVERCAEALEQRGLDVDRKALHRAAAKYGPEWVEAHLALRVLKRSVHQKKRCTDEQRHSAATTNGEST